MLVTTDIWTHGNVLVVEDPSQYASVAHRGWGTELNYTGTPTSDDDSASQAYITADRFCHMAMTTAPVGDSGARLGAVSILLKASPGNGVRLVRVDLWDGGDPLFQGSTLDAASGSTSLNVVDLSTVGVIHFTMPNGLVVRHGLGLTLAFRVNFISPVSVTVFAAGAQFLSVVPDSNLEKERTSRTVDPLGRKPVPGGGR